MTNKTVYIHIGSPKTGTTFIQQVLYDNKKHLKKNGVLYNTKSLPGKNHFYLHTLIKENNADKALNNIIKEFDASNCEKLILSAESLFSIKSEYISYLKHKFNRYNVKIIAYVRRQDSLLQSAHSQQVKADPSRTMPIQELLEKTHNNKNILDYYVTLSRWADGFGKENIIVQPYEKSQLTKGLINNFFYLIDEPQLIEFSKLPQKNLNVRLNKYETELLRIFNVSKIPYKVKNKFIAYFCSQTQIKKLDCELLTYEERKGLLELYKESNKKVATEFLNRENGILFYEEIEKREYNTKIEENKLKDCFENAASNVVSKSEHKKLRACLFEDIEYKESLIQKIKKKIKKKLKNKS